MGLDTLFGWFLDKIEKAAFLTWVYPWQRSIRICGSRVKAMGPGFHWKLPYAMEFNDESVVWGKVLCEQQRVCSHDGTTWLVALTFNMRLVDIVRALVKREEYEGGVVTDAMTIVAEWVNATASDELSIEALKADCIEAIQKKAAWWGCEVKDLGVTDFAPFDRVYCVVGREADEMFPVE